MDRVELYRDAKGEWRWRRISPNGNIVSTSGEGYVRRIDCLEEAEHVNPGIPVAVPDEEP